MSPSKRIGLGVIVGLSVAVFAYIAVLWIAEPNAPHDAEFYVNLRFGTVASGLVGAFLASTYPY